MDTEMYNRKTKRNRMRNYAIQEMASVMETLRKAQERQLYYYGYVMRREENHVVWRTLDLQVEDTEGKMT